MPGQVPGITYIGCDKMARNKYRQVTLGKKTKAQEISEIPLEEIMLLRGEPGMDILRGYVRTLRSSYKRRILSFRKKDLISHAQIALEGSLPPGKQPGLKEMSRNQLLLEFFRYSKFFKDQTSSEKGIKEVNKAQDVRIFGANSRGDPKRTMSNDEREEYWRLYEEFKNQYPEWSIAPYSEDEQKVLAEAMFSIEGFSGLTLTQKLSRVRDLLEKRQIEQNLGDVPNVFAGRGPSSNF